MDSEPLSIAAGETDTRNTETNTIVENNFLATLALPGVAEATTPVPEEFVKEVQIRATKAELSRPSVRNEN